MNTSITVGVLPVLDAARSRVPAEVALVGFGDGARAAVL